MIRADSRPIRFAVAILAVASCLYLIQASARIGFSRLLSRAALITNSIGAAEAAVGLSPSDPEAHRARATVLMRLRYPASEVLPALETATSLRPREDNLWLELGNAREEFGDTAGALAALDQAVRWAPYYGHTHWQRGNLLLRMGRYDEAFAELRTAASADPRYFRNLIDLAWGVSRGDLIVAEQFIQINNDEQRHAFINYLFSAKAFRSAFTLWAHSKSVQTPGLFNGGFEDQLILSEPGFGGWVSSTKNRLAIDVSEKFGGAKSLQINLNGNWTPGMPLLSQTVIVEPSTRYRIYFSVKTKDLVTGGPPLLTVSDASTNEQLGKSQNFPSATTDWTRLSFEFTTPASAEAAVIRLQRNNCEPAPCPIFGVLWLDEISIEHLGRG